MELEPPSTADSNAGACAPPENRGNVENGDPANKKKRKQSAI